MSLPAIVLVDAPVARLKVLTLTLLDRLLVAAHRAGCAPITVVCRGGGPPPARRADALGVEYRVTTGPPEFSDPSLVVRAALLVGAADLERVMERGGRLTSADGQPLPAGVVHGLGGLLEGALEEALEEALAGAEPVAAQGPALPVRNQEEARAAEEALWASLASSADGPMDRLLNRRLGRPFSKLLVRTPVTPNQVTCLSLAIGLTGACLFSLGTYAASVWGAVLFLVCTVIDCVDGDIARALFKETRLGKWFDIGADQVVHIALFIALALGLSRGGSEAPVLALGVSAAVGALVSFAVVVRGLLQPEDRRSPGLARVLDAATSRDFAYLIFALALVGRLEVFLWLAAFGSHLFWMAALALQIRGAPASGVRRAAP